MKKRTNEIKLPMGYEVVEEAKTMRRSFALQPSVFKAFDAKAKRNGSNSNAVINELMRSYVEEAE